MDLKKKLLILIGILLLLSGVFFWGIERVYQKRDEDFIFKLKGERYTNRILYQQIELTTNSIKAYKDGEISKDAADISLNSLNNTYELTKLNYHTLKLQHSTRYNKIHNVYRSYYQITHKETISSDELDNVLMEFNQIRQSVEKDIKSHQVKMKNYWWKKF